MSVATDRTNLLLAVHRARAAAHLPGLYTNLTLSHDAQVRAVQITTDFSHDHAGDLLGAWYWGEILGYTSGISGYPAAAYIVREWLGSSAHKPILLGHWQHVGVGVAHAGGRTYWVAVFGRQ